MLCRFVFWGRMRQRICAWLFDCCLYIYIYIYIYIKSMVCVYVWIYFGALLIDIYQLCVNTFAFGGTPAVEKIWFVYYLFEDKHKLHTRCVHLDLFWRLQQNICKCHIFLKNIQRIVIFVHLDFVRHLRQNWLHTHQIGRRWKTYVRVPLPAQILAANYIYYSNLNDQVRCFWFLCIMKIPSPLNPTLAHPKNPKSCPAPDDQRPVP